MSGARPAGVLVRCRAKINTRLEVLGRRPDGYHELDTEFHSLELHDRLVLRPAEGFHLDVTGPRTGELGEEPKDANLVLRAVRLLQREVGTARFPGVRLRLEKHVPVAAGLGGGSSDAAGALVGACLLAGLEPSPGRLAAMAGELGADVPYFLAGGRQRGTGRGDVLRPLAAIVDTPLLLIRLRQPVSTRAVFEAHARLARPALTSRNASPTFGGETGADGARPEMHYDLWPAACAVAPALAGVFDAVSAALPGWRVGLSGSGPCLFALPPGRLPAAAVAERAAGLAAGAVEVLVTRTIGRDEYLKDQVAILGT